MGMKKSKTQGTQLTLLTQQAPPQASSSSQESNTQQSSQQASSSPQESQLEQTLMSSLPMMQFDLEYCKYAMENFGSSAINASPTAATNTAPEYCIIGVDEAGRGPLAGPVVAATVQIPPEIVQQIPEFELINDSKKLTEKKRDLLFDLIIKHCKYGVGIVDAPMIDKINILNATFLAMRQAILDIQSKGAIYNFVLVDGNHKIREYTGNQEPIIKGDSKSMAIAAASVVAKVTRDRMMVAIDKEYPQYQFAKHKGYGTKKHREVLLEIGKCKYHRDSFLKKILGNAE